MTHNGTHHHDDGQQAHAHGGHAYGLFALNMLLSFLAMYFLMYTMIDTWGDFFHNLNMGYMALTMLAAMGIIMLATMRGMYPNKRLNIAMYAVLAVVFVAALAGIRMQVPIGDKQFIASMIPHHSGAILMCHNAQIADAELQALCASIAEGQREEIEQMRGILARLPG
jgi:uncharacterized protein (DUF305 family)